MPGPPNVEVRILWHPGRVPAPSSPFPRVFRRQRHFGGLPTRWPGLGAAPSQLGWLRRLGRGFWACGVRAARPRVSTSAHCQFLSCSSPHVTSSSGRDVEGSLFAQESLSTLRLQSDPFPSGQTLSLYLGSGEPSPVMFLRTPATRRPDMPWYSHRCGGGSALRHRLGDATGSVCGE